ncbi:MAG: diaminopimelate epimerase [Holosporaceae bacterium]|jgi:diaminopimelate epimerase|nr:diaminopimelate epimerase [Holosporaceae bacterium]
MLIEFHKMQALGNDFVIIEHSCSSTTRRLFEKEFLVNISHRLYGVGCDQVVVFYRENCFIHAFFFNNDGSEAEICGNASRCLGKLMRDFYGMSQFALVAAERDYAVQVNHDSTVSVNMGRPTFKDSAIGFSKKVEDPLNLNPKNDLGLGPDTLHDVKVLRAAGVSVGNPHLAVFVEEIPQFQVVAEVGNLLSTNKLFENRVNVSFVKVLATDLLEQSSFERGTGPTLACGSGACASGFLARACGFTSGSEITVQQRGGTLLVAFNEDESITQTGTASYVFSGRIEL